MILEGSTGPVWGLLWAIPAHVRGDAMARHVEAGIYWLRLSADSGGYRPCGKPRVHFARQAVILEDDDLPEGTLLARLLVPVEPKP